MDWDEEGGDPIRVIYSFHCLICPPNRSELEINAHQLGLMRDLHIPKPAVLLTLANQLDNLRAAPPEPKEVILES